VATQQKEKRMNEQRVQRVMKNLQDMGLSQALITDPLSIFYLTGYHTEPMERFLGLLLVNGTDGVAGTLVTNALFPSAEGAADAVLTYTDAQDPLSLVADACDSLAILGVDKSLAARWLVPLMERQACSGVRLASAAVDGARSVKDPVEQELMRRASLLNDKGMAWLAAQVAEGVTERSIAERLAGAYRELGASGNSFDPIVSFAANAADPHHEPDDTVFCRGDMVLFDVGCAYEGYCADMTRTFFTAAPTDFQLRVYDTVRRANEAAEAMIRPGVLFSKIDLTARQVIEDAGFGPYFTHRLGHQIGLSVHEPGDVSASHHEAVQPGQCFSVEPGIYLPDGIGVRIEDLVIVTDDGCEVLNHYPHEPVVLDV